jgi:ethanolamine transporter EutH
METQIAQTIIVQMVSPAVMVSACGLMLLGLGNKYARVVDRIRAFGAEVRELKKLGAAATAVDTERLHVLELQLPDLYRRGKLLRNAVMYFYIGIFLFVACSIVIPLVKNWLPLALFCAGMACVLVGTVFALREILLSFRLIRLELPESAR